MSKPLFQLWPLRRGWNEWQVPCFDRGWNCCWNGVDHNSSTTTTIITPGDVVRVFILQTESCWSYSRKYPLWYVYSHISVVEYKWREKPNTGLMCFTNCGTREDLPLPMFNVDRRVWVPLFPLMDDIALLRLKHHIPLICTASKTVNKHKMNTPLTPLWLFCVQVRSVSFNNKHTTEGDGSTHSLLIKLEPQKEIEKKYLLYGGDVQYRFGMQNKWAKYYVYILARHSNFNKKYRVLKSSLLLNFITHAKKYSCYPT